MLSPVFGRVLGVESNLVEFVFTTFFSSLTEVVFEFSDLLGIVAVPLLISNVGNSATVGA